MNWNNCENDDIFGLLNITILYIWRSETKGHDIWSLNLCMVDFVWDVADVDNVRWRCDETNLLKDFWDSVCSETERKTSCSALKSQTQVKKLFYEPQQSSRDSFIVSWPLPAVEACLDIVASRSLTRLCSSSTRWKASCLRLRSWNSWPFTCRHQTSIIHHIYTTVIALIFTERLVLF